MHWQKLLTNMVLPVCCTSYQQIFSKYTRPQWGLLTQFIMPTLKFNYYLLVCRAALLPACLHQERAANYSRLYMEHRVVCTNESSHPRANERERPHMALDLHTAHVQQPRGTPDEGTQHHALFYASVEKAAEQTMRAIKGKPLRLMACPIAVHSAQGQPLLRTSSRCNSYHRLWWPLPASIKPRQPQPPSNIASVSCSNTILFLG